MGFDNERHQYGDEKYPAQLVLQDVLTIHGSQFRNAACIVASPPCQEFSYMAMPWSRAKQIARALRGEDEFPEKYEGSRTLAELTALFDACFRIQREASAAAGRHIPLVVENVRGAQPWVGMAKAHYGSFYLWGDVESVGGAVVGKWPKFGETLRTTPQARKFNPDGTEHPQESWFAVADSKNRGSKNDGGLWFAIGSPGQENVGQNPDGRKVPGFRFDGSGRSFQTASVEGQKVPVYSDPAWRKDENGAYIMPDGTKQGGDWFGKGEDYSISRKSSSRSTARKAASAQIAKIPFPLAQHIARIYKP